MSGARGRRICQMTAFRPASAVHRRTRSAAVTVLILGDGSGGRARNHATAADSPAADPCGKDTWSGSRMTPHRPGSWRRAGTRFAHRRFGIADRRPAAIFQHSAGKRATRLGLLAAAPRSSSRRLPGLFSPEVRTSSTGTANLRWGSRAAALGDAAYPPVQRPLSRTTSVDCVGFTRSPRMRAPTASTASRISAAP